jgi:hypothetical protein
VSVIIMRVFMLSLIILSHIKLNFIIFMGIVLKMVTTISIGVDAVAQC